MSYKNVNISKKGNFSNSKKQRKTSKYFIGDTSYPTSFLGKRQISTNNGNKNSSTTKILKHGQESNISAECEVFSSPESTSNKLQHFTSNSHKERSTPLCSEKLTGNLICSSKGIREGCHIEHSSNLCPNECEANENCIQQLGSNIKYTPLEQQYLGFKREYPDAILLIECGYKYKLFDKDAEIACKLFNAASFKRHNFLCAVIYSSFLYFYVKQFALKGYKVAVIKQTETTALKAAGDTRNDLFTRKLHSLYTKSTLIGEEFLANSSNEIQDTSNLTFLDMSSGYLMCICEENNIQDISIAILAIQISSGDMTYAFFQDSTLRNNLETYFVHINPAEILLPSFLTNETENLIKSFTTDRFVRTEKLSLDIFEASFALNYVTQFYTSEHFSKDNLEDYNIDNKQVLLSLPSLVVSCLSALITYLSQFKLQHILKNLKELKPYSTNDRMILSSTTLQGLDILPNPSSHAEYGSLYWVLNRTLTKSGERLLKSWITKPLKNICYLKERLNILTEIIHSESIIFKVIKGILYKLPDLERILCGILYCKCNCFEFLKLLQSFMKIRRELLSIADRINIEIESPRLKVILLDLPELLKEIEEILSNIDNTAAERGDKSNIFRDFSKYPDLRKYKEEIMALEQKLNNLKPEVCKLLNLDSFHYATINAQKYLIEVPHNHLHLVPDNWHKINCTKQVSRFKSPEVIELSNKLERAKEHLINHAEDAWNAFLKEFGTSFFKHKQAVSYLAELDCYLSMAKVAKEEHYCRPDIVESEKQIFHVTQGRHPMLSKIISENHQFVSNDTTMDASNICVIVTGPNMGGKSTYVRQTALIAIMVQIGSYVPADAVKMSLFDMIFARMGAEDDLAHGKSTFMHEMGETAEILQNATSKSFLILDELGRGTSTHDGTAIAYTTLEFLISQVKCLTMFVTHYPSILELQTLYPGTITDIHMGYFLNENADSCDFETVTFLYNVVSGISEKSYGINVAALAGISENILIEAQTKSQEMEIKMKIQRKINDIMMKIKALDSA